MAARHDQFMAEAIRLADGAGQQLAAIALLTLDGFLGGVASAGVPPGLVSVCMCAPKCRRFVLLVTAWQSSLYPQ